MRARKSAGAKAAGRLEDNWRHVERRQWWLSVSSIVLSLVLTVGISLLAIPLFSLEFKAYGTPDKDVLVYALAGLVLLLTCTSCFSRCKSIARESKRPNAKSSSS